MIDDALRHLLATHLGQDVSFRPAPSQLSGGYWASIYGFALERPPSRWEGPLVLRVMPKASSAAKEMVVQRTLAEQGFPTPRVLLDGVDETVGGAFIVMTRAEGAPPIGNLKIGFDVVRLPRVLKAIPKQLADVARRLHAIDPAPIAEALAAAGQTNRLGMDHYLDIVRSAATATDAATGFEKLLAWFDARQPTGRDVVVCHGDLHPFNLMVDDHGDITVLDWTNANIAPREFDLGFTTAFLTCVPIAVPRVLQRGLDALGRRLARSFVNHYGAGAIDTPTMQWYEALQYGRCLGEVAVSRTRSGAVLAAGHPFETAAASMARSLRAITAINVTLPPRPSGV